MTTDQAARRRDRNVGHTEQRKADRRLRYDACRFADVCVQCETRPAAPNRASCPDCLAAARRRTRTKRARDRRIVCTICANG